MEQSLDEWSDEYNRLRGSLRPFCNRIQLQQELSAAESLFSDLHYYWEAALVNSGDVFGYMSFIIDHKEHFAAIGADGTLKAVDELMPFYRQQVLDESERGDYWWRTQEERAPAEALAEGVLEFARLLLAYANKNLSVHEGP
jgi:hypothetical protein